MRKILLTFLTALLCSIGTQAETPTATTAGTYSFGSTNIGANNKFGELSTNSVFIYRNSSYATGNSGIKMNSANNSGWVFYLTSSMTLSVKIYQNSATAETITLWVKTVPSSFFQSLVDGTANSTAVSAPTLTASGSKEETLSSGKNEKTVTYGSTLTAGYYYVYATSAASSVNTYLRSITLASAGCTATANAGADKNTTVNTGVALAATAAGDGKTGAWTVQSAPDGATGDYAPTFSSTSSATATFTPKVKGSYTLRWTVTCTEGESSANDDMVVSVCAPISPTLDYTSTSLTVGAGNSSAPSLDKDGSSGTVTWESDDKDVATVNNSGVVTPVAAGPATITATIAADAENHYCANTATADFTISAAPVSTPVISSVTVDNSTVCVGDDITLTCTASNSPTSYTWYRNTSASTAGAPSLGDATATNTKTTSTSALAAGTYYFYCVATNASGSSDPVFTSAVKVATKPSLTISLAP